jgi:hypothetical protein
MGARAGERVGDTSSGTSEDVTEPLAAVGDCDRALPVQIARFGELVGRDLSARAFAMLRERGAYDPQRHDEARSYRPLTTEEQREVLSLRAALTFDHRPAGSAASADTGNSRPEGPVRPIRLRRPPSPSLHRAARHRRAPDTDPSREP